MASNSFTLRCVILNEPPALPSVFSVIIPVANNVIDLKDAIKMKSERELERYDAHSLVLWQLNVDLPVGSDEDLAERIAGLGQLSQFTTKMNEPAKKMSLYFKNQPPEDNVHIIVEKPVIVSGKRFQHSLASPPKITSQQLKRNLLAAIVPFQEYIDLLARGELDGYMDSLRSEDKLPVPGMVLSDRIHLLLHDLGKPDRVDQERVKVLFSKKTIHLFNTSGSGKTRLVLDGLCKNWGFYISCGSRGIGPRGSLDFKTATDIISQMSGWNRNGEISNENTILADRVFTMLLLARIYVLSCFLEAVPAKESLDDTRRRWVFLQIMPASQCGEDIFTAIIRNVRYGDGYGMLQLARELLWKCRDHRLFGSTPLYCAVDEAQEGLQIQENMYRLPSDNSRRPALFALYRFYDQIEYFDGYIFAGSRNSMTKLELIVRAMPAKLIGRPSVVFTDTVQFTRGDSDLAHRNYISRYLTLSGDEKSNRLLERILYWFHGRPRLTASLLEVLLHPSNKGTSHRVLSAFFEFITGAKLADARDLEDEEGDIPEELMEIIEEYGGTYTVQRVIDGDGGDEYRGLPDILRDVVLRWVMGSELAAIPVENYMHELIALGVGHLKAVYENCFHATVNYPVYIDEPLVILTLLSIFERRPLTHGRTWITDAFAAAGDRSSLGFGFEEMVALVLLENFGRKFTALGEVFHVTDPFLASKKVTLVALRRTSENVMQCYRLERGTYTSDRLCFKASNPEEVLSFLHNPEGITFLLPDDHTGPDVIAFAQEQETGELIVLAVQCKLPRLQAQLWTPVIDEYCKKLCTSTQAHRHERGTPRFLRVICTPDDQQQVHLGRDETDVVVMRREVMQGFGGLMTDASTSPIIPVPP